MEKILFIAKYPTGEDIQDGMAQRIKAVDSEFENAERTYLQISPSPKTKRRTCQNEKLRLETLNFFTHRNTIAKFIKVSDVIYCHSLYNLKFLLPFNIKGKRIILDVHGSVPEEQDFFGNKIKSKIYGILEHKLMPYVTDLICVSNAMSSYYKAKYPKLRQRHIIKPILPVNTLIRPDNESVLALKNKLGITDDDVVFVYSGGLQKWQNFDLTIDFISKHSQPNHKFLILTRQVDEANVRIGSLKEKCTIHIESVPPELLPSYYEIAHYGFILRDDIILNNVAAPTKLIEYLYFGLRPIVKTLNIGDFESYNCDYISIYNSETSFSTSKSKKNQTIAECITTANNNLLSIIFNAGA